jgi:tetratricopeptide (TPR) repeat protein
LDRGAAATLGNVYEPYLQMTSHLNILNDRLLHGFTFAEGAYSSIEVLSWMSVMVGDPLYRPYGAWLHLEAAGDSSKADAWKMYHDFAVQNFSNEAGQYRSLARQAALRARNCPMLEDLGLMEAVDGNFAGATNYLGQAHSCYSALEDILRVILEEADAWNKLKKPKRALDLLQTALRVSGNAPAAPLLKKMEAELRGAGGTPAPDSTPKPTPRVRIRF